MESNLKNDSMSAGIDMQDVVDGVAWLSENLAPETLALWEEQALQCFYDVRTKIADDLVQWMFHLHQKVDAIVRSKELHTRGTSYHDFESAACYAQQMWIYVLDCLQRHRDVAHDDALAFATSMQSLKKVTLSLLERKEVFHQRKFFSTTGNSRAQLLDVLNLLVKVEQQHSVMCDYWVAQKQDGEDEVVSGRTSPGTMQSV